MIKRPQGRPPIPDHLRLDRPTTLHLSENLRDAVERYASDQGITLGEALRRLVCQGLEAECVISYHTNTVFQKTSMF